MSGASRPSTRASKLPFTQLMFVARGAFPRSTPSVCALRGFLPGRVFPDRYTRRHGLARPPPNWVRWPERVATCTSRSFVCPYTMHRALASAERSAPSGCVPGTLRPRAPHTYLGDDGSHVNHRKLKIPARYSRPGKRSINIHKWCMQSAAEFCRLMPRLEIRSDCSRRPQSISDTVHHFSCLGGMRTRST